MVEKGGLGFLTRKLQLRQKQVGGVGGQNTEGFSCSQRVREGRRCYCLVSQEDPGMKGGHLGL